MSDCVFCKIAKGEIPVDFVYRDDAVVVFRDASPQAPTHLLVLPVQHIVSAAEVNDPSVWTLIMGRAVEIARGLGLEKEGFRMVINTGVQGGQTVPHLHLHLLSGRNFGWPPG
ncbi:MAG: histidine triad nucleotide-binding protein [Synergistaceae bacterium]|nr:histidine triad nucleotide-binding protein [Synergistaceae bacterium]